MKLELGFNVQVLFDIKKNHARVAWGYLFIYITIYLLQKVASILRFFSSLLKLYIAHTGK